MSKDREWKFRVGDDVYAEGDDLYGIVTRRMDELTGEEDNHYVVRIFPEDSGQDVEYAEHDLKHHYKITRHADVFFYPDMDDWLGLMFTRGKRDVTGLEEYTSRRKHYRLSGEDAARALSRLFSVLADESISGNFSDVRIDGFKIYHNGFSFWSEKE